jgi:putative methyltransferase (TIGR04325 family)
MKEFIWKLLPGSFRRAWSGDASSPASGWLGNYPDWSSALAQSGGYDTNLILDKVRSAVRKVKKGEAAFERDSVTFDKPDHDPVVLKWLKHIGEAKNNELRVLDFGGSLGSTFFQYRHALGNVAIKEWMVIEQSHFVEAGQSEFENDVLKFRKEIPTGHKADVLLLFSVLPYVEHPHSLLNELVKTEVDYIVVDRTPIVKTNSDILTVQVVPESIYKASYPAWFFSKDKLLKSFSEKFEVLAEYKSKFAADYRLEDGTNAQWMGFILKRK